MKRVIKAVWDFLEAWGEYRYQMTKRHGYRHYY
jgi:hypothetical protein